MMHYDTSSKHSQREMTAILYLNEGWEEGDGGELRLFPFPLGEVDFAPRNDRLAIFNSTEMLHRVMPATAPRACLSLWFARADDAPPVRLPRRLSPELSSGDSAGQKKKRDSLHPHILKWQSNPVVYLSIICADVHGMLIKSDAHCNRPASYVSQPDQSSTVFQSHLFKGMVCIEKKKLIREH